LFSNIHETSKNHLGIAHDLVEWGHVAWTVIILRKPHPPSVKIHLLVPFLWFNTLSTLASV